MRTLWAKTALLPDGWAKDVRLEIAADGRIASVKPGSPAGDTRLDILLPAPANLHSHGFQRAMAGLSERRSGPDGDSFWTWRQLMYRFLQRLTPDHVQAITAFAQMEMLEAGFASVGEFHYLHHQPGGAPYDDLAEMSARILAAAAETGIGLTLLPVLYQTGGCDGRAVAPGQDRFFNDPDRYARLLSDAETALAGAWPDTALGLAPHSLRAVPPGSLAAVQDMARDRPVHIHVAEQTAEVEEVLRHHGARPVEWLFANAEVDRTWCLIHATQMQPHETAQLARSGAVAGLCPITEANLGDGIFDGRAYHAAGGRWGVGTDSNVLISLAEELRLLEYGQRLRERGRAVLAGAAASTGRTLFDMAVSGGAQAAGRGPGGLQTGAWADLLALDGGTVALEGHGDDTILDGFIFAGGAGAIRDVWSAGRHVVTEARHIARDAIAAAYRSAVAGIRNAL